ncbi:MAG TPA: cytochrome c [Rhizomicrobium sp.]|nr:cytochrome c [Rhizomicrobium sp.]
MRSAIFLACCLVAGAVSPASAQDLINGERIAKTWCAACHRVTPNAVIAGGNDAAPSFSSVAQMSSTTETSLEVFLSTPHARMPDYNLTRQEIADVSAYILSLRK